MLRMVIFATVLYLIC